jgi:hypothetical protein
MVPLVRIGLTRGATFPAGQLIGQLCCQFPVLGFSNLIQSLGQVGFLRLDMTVAQGYGWRQTGQVALESPVAGVPHPHVGFLNVVGHHDAFAKLRVGGYLTIDVLSDPGILQAGLTKDVGRGMARGPCLRPLHQLLVEPVTEIACRA